MLTITPEQSLEVPFPISLVVEEEIRIPTSALCQVTDDCLSITSSNCLHLIAMLEIIQVPCCKSNLIIPTILHFHNIHYLVFADPRNLHRHNISILLIADSSM